MTPKEMKEVNKRLLEKLVNDKKNRVKEENKNIDFNKRKEIKEQYTQVSF